MITAPTPQLLVNKTCIMDYEIKKLRSITIIIGKNHFRFICFHSVKGIINGSVSEMYRIIKSKNGRMKQNGLTCSFFRYTYIAYMK